MKKLFALAIVALTLTFASCAGKESKSEAADSTVAPVEQPVVEADTTAADTAVAQ